MADVKMEIKSEIKLDPADSPTKLADIDEFEDDTDLNFPASDAQAWLIKVSGDMWKAWNDMYQDQPDDAQIQVGTLRVYYPPADGSRTERVEIRLDPSLEKHRQFPKVLDVDLTTKEYNNTVVFSEKDLDRHRAKQVGNSRNLAAGKPSGITGKSDRYGPRKPGSYRTAIPKQTILAPRIAHEGIAKPAEDESSLDFFKQQYDAAMHGGNKTNFIKRIDKRQYHPGAAATGFTFGSITSKPGKGLTKKQPKEKNVRMSEEALLDALQQCFSQYPYWSIKALRNRLRQPDAWTKEVLEKIAVLVRSGDFMGHYMLNENTKRLLNIKDSDLKEEAAPVKSEVESDQGTGDEMGDEDDDMGDFEDVKME